MRGHEGLVGGDEPEGYEGGGVVSRAARLRLLREQLERPFMDEFRRMLAERPIGISAREDAAEQILRDGRFKSQFETGRSGGHFGPERARLESRLFGEPETADPERRRIYGALRSAWREEQPSGIRSSYRAPWEGGTSHYGDHVFLLRPEAKGRSTYTLDDSFAYNAPYAHQDPRLERAFRFDEAPPPGALFREFMRSDPRPTVEGRMRQAEAYLRGQHSDSAPNPGRVMSLNGLGSPYIETQTEGPVYLDEVAALLAPRNIRGDTYRAARSARIPVHASEDVMHDRDLQRHLGLRVAVGGAGLGAVEAGFEREDDGEPERYADGGRVGVVRGLTEALVEGMAPRTRQNPRGLPMDEASRRLRAESMGFDLDRPLYHGTSADADFRGFRQKDRGVWSSEVPHEANLYAIDNESMRPGRNTASRVIPLVSRAEAVREPAPADMDRMRFATNYAREQAEVFRRMRAQGADGVRIGQGVQVDLDVRNLRSPHATFDPARRHEADLLAGLGGGVAAGAAAHEGLVGGETDPEEYQDGGLVRRGIRAFHGSPHRFDRFDLSRVGTGEGAQAYGHGLYFAEDEAIARHYRNKLSRQGPGDGLLIDGQPVSSLRAERPRSMAWWQALDQVERATPSWSASADDVGAARSAIEQASRDVVDVAERPFRLFERHGVFPGGEDGRRWATSDVEHARAVSEHLRALAQREMSYRRPGAMYEVNLGVDPEALLDWDAPLSGQTALVRRGLDELGVPDRHHMDGGSSYMHLVAAGDGQDKASRMLSEAGIPGLRYLDAGSRQAGSGSRNIVMFDDQPIEIIRRYAQGGMAEVDDAEGYQDGGLIRRGIRAFHGSPHRFDRFDISKLGSGEGNQAYGRGLYFAENEEVARGYRDTLSPRAQAERATQTFLEQWQPMFRRAAAQGQTVDDAVVAETLQAAGMPELRGVAEDPGAVGILRRLLLSEDNVRGGTVSPDTLQQYRRLSDRMAERLPAGHMYEVDLAVDPERVLDFQRPLARQPAPVQEVVRGLGFEVAPLPSEAQLYDRARRYFNSDRLRQDAAEDFTSRAALREGHSRFEEGPEAFHRWAADGGAEDSPLRARLGDQFQRAMRTGGDVYRDLGHRAGVAENPGLLAGINPRASSDTLLGAGVPGLRYRDAGSRSALGGTDNIVTFSDEPVEIIRRYALGGLAGGEPAAPNAPGHDDEVAATQGAAQRGLAQAAQLWSAAGEVLRAHEGVVA
jgi:hypothetical protein